MKRNQNTAGIKIYCWILCALHVVVSYYVIIITNNVYKRQEIVN